MASTPGYFKIYNSENKEWLYIKLHSRRANGTFEIQNYVRTDAKNKNEGQVLITMGEAKRTEFKLGKELGEGEDFYTRGPMMIYKHDAMKKKSERKESRTGESTPAMISGRIPTTIAR